MDNSSRSNSFGVLAAPIEAAFEIANLPIAAFGLVQRKVGDAARSMLTAGSGEYPEFDIADASDPGIFGPGSITWRIHADKSMLIGGLRALFVQSLHPLAIAGVAEHSAYRSDPLGRLARTGRFVATTTYGSTPEAQKAIEMVRRVHLKVRGQASDGRSYSANDPALLSWVHNVEVESFLVAYRTYGKRITEKEADTYVQEMRVLGLALGADDLPETSEALSNWISNHPDAAPSDKGHEVVRFLVLPPLPLPVMPAYGLMAAAAIELLSLRQRVSLRLPLPIITSQVVIKPSTAALLAVLGWALGPPPPMLASLNISENR
ncbi:MAG: oxygenase MpaB family protein [Actinomycetes bacterium]